MIGLIGGSGLSQLEGLILEQQNAARKRLLASPLRH